MAGVRRACDKAHYQGISFEMSSTMSRMQLSIHAFYDCLEGQNKESVGTLYRDWASRCLLEGSTCLALCPLPFLFLCPLPFHITHLPLALFHCFQQLYSRPAQSADLSFRVTARNRRRVLYLRAHRASSLHARGKPRGCGCGTVLYSECVISFLLPPESATEQAPSATGMSKEHDRRWNTRAYWKMESTINASATILTGASQIHSSRAFLCRSSYKRVQRGR